MKYFRLASFLFAASTLAALLFGTFGNLFAAFGFVEALQAIGADPRYLLLGFYETVGQIGLNIDFWAWNGPFVAVGLLVLVLINAVT